MQHLSISCLLHLLWSEWCSHLFNVGRFQPIQAITTCCIVKSRQQVQSGMLHRGVGGTQTCLSYRLVVPWHTQVWVLRQDVLVIVLIDHYIGYVTATLNVGHNHMIWHHNNCAMPLRRLSDLNQTITLSRAVKLNSIACQFRLWRVVGWQWPAHASITCAQCTHTVCSCLDSGSDKPYTRLWQY